MAAESDTGPGVAGMLVFDGPPGPAALGAGPPAGAGGTEWSLGRLTPVVLVGGREHDGDRLQIAGAWPRQRVRRWCADALGRLDWVA